MTGKGIEGNAAGILILILPIALAIVLILKAWPLLLGLALLAIAFKMWQEHQWRQWSQKVNPLFSQLITENQGCITPLDLSLKANLTANSAKRFLEKKAEEYGAQRKNYEGKGIVYYFLTASALGSIFDQSEPTSELEFEPEKLPAGKRTSATEVAKLLDNEEEVSQKATTDTASTPVESPVEKETEVSSETETDTASTPVKSSVETETEVSSQIETDTASTPVKSPVEKETDTPSTSVESPVEKETDTPSTSVDTEKVASEEEQKASTESEQEPENAAQGIIQAELAKRLEVHSSTVGKRKTDADFAEWSQSKDPEGIAWEYSPDTRMFSPIETKQE
ncbi:MAG: hypothetical protein SAL07_00925 [Oscillatoria sp. PMC 1051.18]|nr:hypothetical protein [Oscillatoria sp. PMC 1050.18]MEC5028447.1 hypothetical protein [Oscillatoria sp. PMC 1051.18]